MKSVTQLKLAASAALLALAAAATAGDYVPLTFSSAWPETPACRHVGNSLLVRMMAGGVGRVFCDCAPKDTQCWAWDKGGMMVGVQRGPAFAAAPQGALRMVYQRQAADWIKE